MAILCAIQLPTCYHVVTLHSSNFQSELWGTHQPNDDCNITSCLTAANVQLKQAHMQSMIWSIEYNVGPSDDRLHCSLTYTLRMTNQDALVQRLWMLINIPLQHMVL